MRRLVLMLLAAGCASGQPQAPSSTPQVDAPLWTLDFMRTKPGQQARYVAYVEANWARSRTVALRQGIIVSYRLLVTDPAADVPWDVVLMTEWPDSATYANREALFRPLLDAQGETLIDGLSGRGPDNPLKTTVLQTVARSPTAQPPGPAGSTRR